MEEVSNKKTTLCKSCQKEVAKSVTKCPHCGEKLRTSLFVKLLFWLVGIVVFVSIFGSSDENRLATTPKPDESAYINAEGLDYRAAMLQDLQLGHMTQFEGEVVQVVGTREVRLYLTGPSPFDSSSDAVILLFDEDIRVLEEDILSIKGRYNGIIRYETIFGATISVPSILVDYYTVIEPRQ